MGIINHSNATTRGGGVSNMAIQIIRRGGSNTMNSCSPIRLLIKRDLHLSDLILTEPNVG